MTSSGESLTETNGTANGTQDLDDEVELTPEQVVTELIQVKSVKHYYLCFM